MSMLKERLSGQAVSVWLAREMESVRRDLERAHERSARTLVKNQSLRVVLVGVRPTGRIAEHCAEGSITVQVLEGCVELHTDRRSWTIGAGMLLSLDAGIPHSVSTMEGGIFLLTIVNAPRRPDPPTS